MRRKARYCPSSRPTFDSDIAPTDTRLITLPTRQAGQARITVPAGQPSTPAQARSRPQQHRLHSRRGAGPGTPPPRPLRQVLHHVPSVEPSATSPPSSPPPRPLRRALRHVPSVESSATSPLPRPCPSMHGVAIRVPATQRSDAHGFHRLFTPTVYTGSVRPRHEQRRIAPPIPRTIQAAPAWFRG
jgi:hypothetical protein